METLLVKNVGELLNHTSVFDLLTEYTVFRGQSVRGKLLPGIAREYPNRDTTEGEKALLETLSRVGATRIASQNNSQWDLLVLAQHYAMKTRLLDWTSNALAALWFACSGRVQGSAYVYALNADSSMLRSASEIDPFAISETRLVQPRLSNDRIVAQNGWFTSHSFSEQAGRFVPLEEEFANSTNLTEFVIPADYIKWMLIDLDRCGVNQSTLFPDLEGLCRYLNWKHVEPDALRSYWPIQPLTGQGLR